MKRSKTLSFAAQIDELSREFNVVVMILKADDDMKHPLVMKAYPRQPNGKIKRESLCTVPANQKGINELLVTLNSLEI